MKKETALIVIVSALIIVIIGAFYVKSDLGHYGDIHHDESFSETMDTHDDHMMQMSATSEREFIEMMIPHHQEAVDTAKEVLERGATTPEMQELVTGIIAAQEKEISDMKRWYEEWYGLSYASKDAYEPMMRELANLDGVELDKAFLKDMIMHHMGAIMMARSVEPYIAHEEVRILTDNIIDSQSEEIEHMNHELRHF